MDNIWLTGARLLTGFLVPESLRCVQSAFLSRLREREPCAAWWRGGAPCADPRAVQLKLLRLAGATSKTGEGRRLKLRLRLRSLRLTATQLPQQIQPYRHGQHRSHG